ncbi:MAG: beta-glucuronidase [Ignavibacteriales bacterium]|nr:beta-glucuronidase [Ignavibacteriales bacterium]
MKFFTKIFLLTILITTCTFGQSTIIANIPNRVCTSLDGYWQVLVDPFENGYYDYRYMPRNDGFFKNQKPKNRWEHIEYDFDKSFTLHVPGDWNTQKPELFFYQGTVWYKKSFDFIAQSGKRYFLSFGACNYKAIVYLNGNKIGEHEGGFTPFGFDITGKLFAKDNFVVVKVDNRVSLETIPMVNTDWWNYGGITRSVAIITTSETYIHDYSLQLKKGSQHEVSGWVKISDASAGISVNVRIPELQIETEAKTGTDGIAQIRFNGNFSLWSPENPKLYDVVLQTGNEVLHEQIGFRTIETAGTNILLNGNKIYLRGISIHEEAPMRTGRAYCEEDAEILLRWAKDLGCNFVRLAHYPHNENMVRAADKLGLLVWSEIPVYWTIQWENKATLANAVTQLTDMITRDKNRAAVILWSVSNETPLSEPRLNFLNTLVNKARELDNTRLITAALERHYANDTTQLIDDPLGKFLDVLGCNEYIGWYDGLPAKADNMQWKTVYDKPHIISEFGGEALYGFHSDTLTAWSEESQAYLYEHQLAMLQKVPFISGMSPWILMDFRSPRRQLPGMQDYFNRKGLISEKGEKKMAFYTLQKFYKDLHSKLLQR